MLTIKKLAIVLASILQVQASFKSVTSDRLIITRNSRFRPLVTKTFGQLIYVSFPAYPQPKIKLETEQINDLPCEIDFPTMNDTEYPLIFDSLANGKLILTVMGSEDLLYHYLLTMIVDPEKCEYLAIMTALNETSEFNLNNRDYKDSIIVVAGEDEFDIFFKKHQHCVGGKACRLRYTDKGVLIGTSDFLIPEDAESWIVNTVDEKDFTNGYFFSVLKRDRTIVQRLDQDLKVQKELILGKSFLYSASNGNVNHCRGISSTDLNCELRNVEFEDRTRAIVEAEYFKNFMRAVRLFNLSDGSAMILYILQVYVEPSIGDEFTTYLQHVDLHGHASNPVKFQEDVCKDFKDIGMIRMKDNFYCFSVYCRDTIHTKCAAIGEV